MHKRSFVEKVDVEINEDYLDIHLIDKGGNVIDKNYQKVNNNFTQRL